MDETLHAQLPSCRHDRVCESDVLLNAAVFDDGIVDQHLTVLHGPQSRFGQFVIRAGEVSRTGRGKRTPVERPNFMPGSRQ